MSDSEDKSSPKEDVRPRKLGAAGAVVLVVLILALAGLGGIFLVMRSIEKTRDKALDAITEVVAMGV